MILDTTSSTRPGRLLTKFAQLFMIAESTLGSLSHLSVSKRRKVRRTDLLASVKQLDDPFKQLHPFGLQNWHGDERMVCGTHGETDIVLVLQLGVGPSAERQN